ncbi:MAG TPA: hypothetical protein VMW53_07255 [archaeon]|nr:hypothetical protein [archaeon]
MTVHEPGDPFVTLSWKFGMEVAWNSFYDYYTRAGTVMGQCVEVIGDTQAAAYSFEFATVWGTIEVLRFWSYFWNADNTAAAPTKLYYDLYDRTNAVDITLDGTDCTNVEVASLLGRIDTSLAAVNLMDSDQARIVDGAVGLELSAPFIVNAKNGAATRMRLHFTSTGGPVDFTVCHEIVWRPLNSSGYLYRYYPPT